MSAKSKLRSASAVAMSLDRLASRTSLLLTRIGYNHRPGMLTENGEGVEYWRVQRAMERCPYLGISTTDELQELLTRIHGELAKCEALVDSHESPFRVNQIKEPQ